MSLSCGYQYAEEKSWHPLTVTRLIHAREDPIRSNSLNGRILDLFIRVMTPRGSARGRTRARGAGARRARARGRTEIERGREREGA